MSKFFAAGASDIDSDESGSEDAGLAQVQVQVQQREQQNMLMYDSSSSEEEKRVVRSLKDKRHDAMKATIRLVRNSLKINDWVATMQHFDALVKQYEKSKKLIAKEGIPRFYIQLLVHLQDGLNDALQQDKDTRKKWSSSNNRSLNTMKQKVRKYVVAFEKFMTQYRANPDHEVDHSDDFSEEDEDEESESEEEETESEEEESEDEDELVEDDFTENDFPEMDDDLDLDLVEGSSSDESDIDLSHPAMSRAFWVKKTKDADDDLSKADRRKLRKPKADATRVKVKVDATKKEIEFTPEVIQKQLRAILAARGKRGADRSAAIEELTLLASKASTDPAVLKVKMTLLSALFDYTFNTGVHMPVPMWKSALAALTEVIDMLNSNDQLRLVEDDDEDETVFVDDDIDDEEGAPAVSLADAAAAEPAVVEPVAENADAEQPGGVVAPRLFQKRKREERADGLEYVAGSVYAFAKRLADEFVMSLLSIDSHSHEYFERLGDEIALLRLLALGQRYYERTQKHKFIALLALLRIESLYTKYNPACDRDFDGVCEIGSIASSGDPLALIRGEDILLHRLTALVYNIGDSRAKTRAVICTVYHYAMHNHFYKARDLLLMSHIQDNITAADVGTQILFNRAMAQLGVCAFRSGLMRQSLNCLADLHQTGKIKELLAQGITQTRWNQERDLEKEKLERRRQQPYHMHISLDLLEGVHLVSAMLLEVPNLSEGVSGDKRYVISRAFRRVWDSFHKNAFNGPPDNTRDYVVAAAVALSKGDWNLAHEHLMSLKLWTLLPHADVAKQLLLKQVKEVGLRRFLVSFSDMYASIDCGAMARRFELSEREVHQIASKLISTYQFAGAWDQPTNSIAMKSMLPNSLESAALKFADMVAVFVDQNERLMEHRHVSNKSEKRGGNWARNETEGGGSFGDKDRRRRGDDSQQHQQQQHQQHHQGKRVGGTTRKW